MTITESLKSIGRFLTFQSRTDPQPFLAENYLPSPSREPDEHLWTPITFSVASRRIRNLPRLTQEQTLNLAHYFYAGNPLGRRIVDIMAEYCIGDGLKYEAADEKVKRILDLHWTDPTNSWAVNQFERTRELGLTGELIIPAYVNPSDGHVTLGHIDPLLVDTIVEDPENGMKPYAVVLRKQPRENFRRVYKIIDLAETDPDSPVYGRLVGLPQDDTEQDQWRVPFKRGDLIQPRESAFEKFNVLHANIKAQFSGQCFFFKVNSPMGASRGWSDLLHNLDWIDAHDKFLFAEVEKAIESAKYVLDTTITGADQATLNKYRIALQMRKPMENFVHNEAITNQFMNPNLQLEDASILAGALKNHILAGAGMPPIWFSESMTARASAPEMTEPSFKHIRIRQRYIASAMAKIFRYVIDMAAVYGTLRSDSRLSTDNQLRSTAFFLKLPDVSAKDQRALSVSIANFSRALNDALEGGFMIPEQATIWFNRYLEMTGLNSWRDEPTSPEVSDTTTFSLADLLKLAPGESRQVEVTRNGSTYYVYKS